jgi:hypothetical protein
MVETDSSNRPQIIDGDELTGETKEKLCGDLTSWVPISATISDNGEKRLRTTYTRNILIKCVAPVITKYFIVFGSVKNYQIIPKSNGS